jgi:hypothetical protein
MTTFSGSGTDEIYCIINSSDSVEELADEINMRVSAATRSLIDCKNYGRVSKAFSKLCSAKQLLEELNQSITPDGGLGPSTPELPR